MTDVNGSYETRGVSEGAYRPCHRGAFLTHVAEIGENGVGVGGDVLRVLCSRVKAESVYGSGARDPMEVATCPTCARRDPRPTRRSKQDGPA